MNIKLKTTLSALVLAAMAATAAPAATPSVWLRAETEHSGLPATNGAYVIQTDDFYVDTNDFHSPPPPAESGVSNPTNYYRPVYSDDVPRQGRILDPLTTTLYENARSFQFDRNYTKAERLLSPSRSGADAFAFGTNSFTIEFFAKTDGTNTWNQTDSRLFGNFYTSTNNWQLMLETRARWRCNAQTHNAWMATNSLTNVTVAGRWYHHALVFDRETPAAPLVRIYVDYNLVGTAAFSSNACYTGNGYFEIGNYYYESPGITPNACQGWHGLLDEIRIMRGALTTDQFLRAVPYDGVIVKIY